MTEHKDYRAAFTPPAVADRLVQLAELQDKGMVILDPCAGEGAIPAAILRAFPRIMKGPYDEPSPTIDVCEINPDYHKKLFSLNTNETGNRVSMMGEDFLSSATFKITTPEMRYDRVIMNPPFDEDLWADFLNKSYSLLVPGGVMVSIIPWSLRSAKLGDFMKGKKSEVHTPIENWVKKENGKPSDWKIAILKVWKNG